MPGLVLAEEEEEESSDVEYKDAAFHVSSLWSRVSKADELPKFYMRTLKKADITLTADRVKLASLSAIGSPKDISEKTLAIEKKKDGFEKASINKAEAVSDDAGKEYYVIDYNLETSRRHSRITYKVGLGRDEQSDILYILTVRVPIDKADELADDVAETLKSFYVKS